MEYCIVEDGVIVNIIAADEGQADTIGALPVYDGAVIGGSYDPPKPEPEPAPPTQLDRVEAQAAYTALMTDTLLESEG